VRLLPEVHPRERLLRQVHRRRSSPTSSGGARGGGPDRDGSDVEDDLGGFIVPDESVLDDSDDAEVIPRTMRTDDNNGVSPAGGDAAATSAEANLLCLFLPQADPADRADQEEGDHGRAKEEEEEGDEVGCSTPTAVP
jgi:hypothetical protein